MSESSVPPISQTKKWFKKKRYIIGMVVLFVVSALVVRAMTTEVVPVYETVRVERGVLAQTVSAVGNVQSSDELDLRFESAGRIARVLVDLHDEIEAGDVVAELDLGEFNARVAQASAGVARAESQRDRVLAGETDEYVSGLRSKLDQVEANLAQVRATTRDMVAQAEASFKRAEIDLMMSEGGDDSQVVRNAYDDAVALLSQVQSSISKALTESDNILGVDNTFANSAYVDALAIQNLSKLYSAKFQYQVASESRKAFDVKMSTISLGSTQSAIDSTLDSAQNVLLSVREMLLLVSEVLDATIAVGGMTQSTLDSLKSIISVERTTNNTHYSSLISRKQALQTAKNSYGTSQVAYTLALQNVNNARAKADADIAASEALVAQAQSQYNQAANPPRPEDVRNAYAQVSEARAALALAVASRNKARIVAPVGGVVAKLPFKAGSFVTSQDVIAKLVSPRFEIRVDIPETDIVKIATGVETDITLDAYGSDVVFTGVVTEIEIGETVIQDVVYYKVTVALIEDEREYQILNGMTADVTFYTEEKEGVLYVPQRVVRADGVRRIVRVMKNGEVREVEVVTGLRGDNGLIEIVSGLSEGDEVVIREISS